MKKAAITHWSKQFKKRNHKFDSIDEEWAEIYTPINSINHEWYAGIDDEPDENEWKGILKATNNKSAAGHSGIGYRLIKKAPSDMQNILRKFATLCLKKGLIPETWKITSLYPIPKPSDWNYALAN